MSRSPSLAAAVTGTLAFAIAGVVTILALINAVILRPLPFPEARQLHTVQAYNATGEIEWLSFPTFADWQKHASSFDTLAALTVADFNVLGGDHAETILAALVSPAFFQTVGVRPDRGRAFDDADYGAGSERVVILSHSFWQRRFGGDAEILGRTVRLAGPEYLDGSDGRYTVIGIMPDRFWLFWKRFDVLVPLRASAQQMSDRRAQLIERVFGRLRRDASLESARLELTLLTAAPEREFGRQAIPASVVVTPTQEAHFADVRPVLWLLGVTDTFTYKTSDGIADSAPATVSINIERIDDPPTAQSGSASVREDGATSISLQGNNPEDPALSFRIVTLPVHGDLTGVPPFVTYTPDPNCAESDSFTFVTHDGVSDSAVATISIIVQPVNDPPVPGADLVLKMTGRVINQGADTLVRFSIRQRTTVHRWRPKSQSPMV